jgi:hypothetical protein
MRISSKCKTLFFRFEIYYTNESRSKVDVNLAYRKISLRTEGLNNTKQCDANAAMVKNIIISNTDLQYAQFN